MSSSDIQTRVEEILSKILSDKYHMKIKIKFKEKSEDGNNGESRDIEK